MLMVSCLIAGNMAALMASLAEGRDPNQRDYFGSKAVWMLCVVMVSACCASMSVLVSSLSLDGKQINA